jgi:eukaryotic-like serine/threonine-protein kinase
VIPWAVPDYTPLSSMLLTSGAHVGKYAVTGPLGAGGMGEVYRARDSTLQRDVAIKILPQAFALDPERRARFEREAQILASLNHPNIAQIYGVEDMGGTPALVMELVEGPTLAESISARPHASGSRSGGSLSNRGPSSGSAAYSAREADGIRDTLEIARQIVDALEAAHEQGIVHRDLKPGNIKVRPDGTVKVLDFGLARALDPAGASEAPANSPTLTDMATQVGVLLGTAAYMAPEQVKGRQADRRADIWAFGVVLYELLTRANAFEGESTSEILARVMEREPDWGKLPASTPSAIVRLLRRTLVKDPKRRLQSIGDARLDIDEALTGSEPPVIKESVAPRRAPLVLAALAGGALVALAVIVLSWTNAPTPTAAPPGIRASIALPDGIYLDGAGPPELALSPDGRTLAYIGRDTAGAQRLYVRRLDEEAATPVPGSETVEGPFFSPDGRWVAFAVGVSALGDMPPELRKYSLETGLTQTITSLVDYFGGVWLTDGAIVYVNYQPAGLWKVQGDGGQPQQIVPAFTIDGEESVRPVAWPSLLPGGEAVLVSEWSAASLLGELAVVDLATGRMTRLGIEGSGAHVLPGGYLVYANRAAVLMAAPFDVDTLRVTGTPVALMSDIAFGRNSVPVFAFSPTGTLVFATGYLRGSRREPMRLVRASRGGELTVLPFEPDLLYRGFSLSPDGSRLAVGAWDGSKWIFDLRRETRQRIAPAIVTDMHSLAWSPDGRRLAMTGPVAGGSTWGVLIEPVDGSGGARPFAEVAGAEIMVGGWKADGRVLVGRQNSLAGRSPIVLIEEGQPVQVIAEEPGSVLNVRISPDGRWLALDSTATGRFEVYVLPLSGTGARVAVTARGGMSPEWSGDGRQLFFRRDSALMVVDVDTTSTEFQFSAERKLFDWDVAREYAVGPGGQFYSMQPVPGAALQNTIQLRTGWFAEVERRVAR